MSSVVLLVLALAGLGAYLAVLEAVIRRPLVASGIVVAGTVLVAVVPLPGLTFGGINVVPFDIVMVGILGVAAVARHLRLERLTGLQRLLLAFVAVTALSLLRGVVTIAIPTAVNEARVFLWFLSVAAYFATVHLDGRTRERLARMWVSGAVVLLLLAVARWLALPLGLDSGPLESGAGGMRVLNAEQTLFIGQGLFILLVDTLRSGWTPARRWGIAGMLTAVVLLQHRTVWIVLLVGFLVLAIRADALRRRVGQALVLGVVVAVTLVATVFGQESTAVTEQLTDSATNLHTFTWRFEGWVELAGDIDEPITAAIGLPFGTGYERRVDDQLVDVSPHNFYLEAYLRTGLLGLGILLALYAGVLRRLVGGPPRGGLLTDETLLVLAITQLVLYLTYAPSLEQGLILGLLVAVGNRARVPEPEAVPA